MLTFHPLALSTQRQGYRHAKRLRVDAKRAQGPAALSREEFERFVTAAREHFPNALAIVLLLGLYGLRVSEVCELQL